MKYKNLCYKRKISTIGNDKKSLCEVKREVHFIKFISK